MYRASPGIHAWCGYLVEGIMTCSKFIEDIMILTDPGPFMPARAWAAKPRMKQPPGRSKRRAECNAVRRCNKGLLR